MTFLKRSLLGLAAAAALAAPVRAAEVEPLLPAETEAVIYVNVRQILDSELIKKYALGQMKQALEGADAKKQMDQLGIDPLKDIDRVTVGSWGKDPNNMQGVGVVHGRFNPTTLFAAAQDAAKKEADKVSIEEEDGVKLVKFTPEKEGAKPVYAAVASEKTVVVGADKAQVAATTKAAQDAPKPAVKKELAALLLSMDEKASMFACGLTDNKNVELPPNLSLPGVDGAKLAKQVENVRNLTVTLNLTEEIGLDIGFGMKDAESADDFAGTVQQLVDTAKAFLPILAGQQPNAKPLVDDVTKSLKSKVKEKDVVIGLKISADGIGKLSGGGAAEDKDSDK